MRSLGSRLGLLRCVNETLLLTNLDVVMRLLSMTEL